MNPTPTQWQAVLLGKIPKGTSKQASLELAREIDASVLTHDQADAVNLAVWAGARD